MVSCSILLLLICGTVSYTFLKFSKSVCYKSSLYDNNHLRLPNVFRTSVTYISQLTMDHRTATQSALDHRKAASKLKLSVDLFSSAQHHLNFFEQCYFDFRLRNQDILRQALYRSAFLSFTFSECRFRKLGIHWTLMLKTKHLVAVFMVDHVSLLAVAFPFFGSLLFCWFALVEYFWLWLIQSEKTSRTRK